MNTNKVGKSSKIEAYAGANLAPLLYHSFFDFRRTGISHRVNQYTSRTSPKDEEGLCQRNIENKSTPLLLQNTQLSYQ